MLTVTREKPTYDSGISKDGEKLILYPASKRIFEEIAAIPNQMKRKDTVGQLQTTYRLLAIILSVNTAGVTVTEEELEELDPLTAAEIIREYMEFMKGLSKRPN